MNVVLAAHAWDVSGSASMVGLLILAQLGPLLLLATVTGAVTDFVNRRLLLSLSALVQAAFAVVVATFVAWRGSSLVLLVVPVIFCGLGQALFLPAYSSLLPSLVPQEQLPRVLALNSAILSTGRIAGPTVGALIYALAGPAPPMALVAALFAAVLVLTRWIPPTPCVRSVRKLPLRELSLGFRVARHDAVVRRILVTITLFSIFCLPFLNQMPTVAEENLGINARETRYSILFATLGVGSLVGGWSIGTIFVAFDRAKLTRGLLWVFGVLLAVFSFVHTPAVAFPLLFCLGAAYFAVVTALITRLQMHLSDKVRGRVMALWFMGFGGSLPVGAAMAGPVIEAISATAVLLIGSAVSLGLGAYVGRSVPRAAPSRHAYRL